MTGWTREVHEIHEAIQDRILFRSPEINARDPDAILRAMPAAASTQATQPAAPRPNQTPKKKGKKDRFTPAKSVCRDCGTGCTIPRWHHFRAARPRCQRCGGSLDYTGPY